MKTSRVGKSFILTFAVVFLALLAHPADAFTINGDGSILASGYTSALFGTLTQINVSALDGNLYLPTCPIQSAHYTSSSVCRTTGDSGFTISSLSAPFGGSDICADANTYVDQNQISHTSPATCSIQNGSNNVGSTVITNANPYGCEPPLANNPGTITLTSSPAQVYYIDTSDVAFRIASPTLPSGTPSSTIQYSNYAHSDNGDQDSWTINATWYGDGYSPDLLHHYKAVFTLSGTGMSTGNCGHGQQIHTLALNLGGSAQVNQLS